MGVLASAFFTLSNAICATELLQNTVWSKRLHTAFTEPAKGIMHVFEKENNVKTALESLYYITGWLIHATNKASKHRKESLKQAMKAMVDG